MAEEYDETAVDAAPLEQDLQLQDGDILRFPLIEVGSKGSPLSIRWEIEIVTGAHGKRLGLQQAKVFREIETYLTSKQTNPEKGLQGTLPPE
jgi:hypothetical protein